MSRFQYRAGDLPGGNDLVPARRMTIEDALVQASVNEAIGFTWQGERDPEGEVWIYIKSSACSKNASSEASIHNGWHTMLKKEPTSGFKYRAGDLPGGNDLVPARRMTIDDALVQASVNEAIGFTWQGDRDPEGEVWIYIKSSACSKNASSEASIHNGWHTMLKTEPTSGSKCRAGDLPGGNDLVPARRMTIDDFKYRAGDLPGGNDLVPARRMTIEDALVQASVSEATGFTWQGDRDPKGEVMIYIKTSACSKHASSEASIHDGWHTMLKKQELPAVLGCWPKDKLDLLDRAGDGRVGFLCDPLPDVLAGLGGQRFVDADFPPLDVSIGGGACGRASPPLIWKAAPEIWSTKRHSLASRVKVKVHFKNTTDDTLQVHWVSFSGEDQPWCKLAPGTSKEIQTFETHVGRFQTLGERYGVGKELFCYTCTADAKQEVSVEDCGDETLVEGGRSSLSLFRNQSCCADDVVQGHIGDCWLMQAVSSVGHRFPDSVVQIFNPKQISEQGVYSIRLWSPSEQCFMYILIDDYLPTQDGKNPYFAHCNARGDGLWVALLEKAFAKLQGSYSNLDASKAKDTPAQALCRILQGQPGHRSWGEEHWEELIYSETLWKEIVERRLGGKCNVLSSARARGAEHVGQNGLVTYHGYTLMDVQEVREFKFLKIRNVWGHQEWNGDWSDESPLWKKHPHIKAQLGLAVEDDGIFWMAYPDFVKNFCLIWHN